MIDYLRIGAMKARAYAHRKVVGLTLNAERQRLL